MQNVSYARLANNSESKTPAAAQRALMKEYFIPRFLWFR